MKLASAVFIPLILLGACATNKVMQAVGGSRTDGVVRLAYSYGTFEEPRIDGAQGSAVARAQCTAWGYSDAKPFGGSTEQCVSPNSYGCDRTQVIVEYQCTGGAAMGGANP